MVYGYGVCECVSAQVHMACVLCANKLMSSWCACVHVHVGGCASVCVRVLHVFMRLHLAAW